MSIAAVIIDVVLVGIVGLCVWRGYKNKIVGSLIGIAALVIAICVSGAVSSTYSGEFTGMFNPFIGGIVDTKVSEVMNIGAPGTGVLTDEEKTDTYAVSYAAIQKTGLNEKVSADLAKETDDATDSVGRELATTLADVLCIRMTYVLAFIVLFILLAIVFAVIGNLINLSFGIPGLNRADKIAGAVLGAVRGVIIILVIACAARYACVLLGAGKIEKTVLLELIVNHNPIAAALGI
jgi:uncharacterized membrane protein required for colicin V production